MNGFLAITLLLSAPLVLAATGELLLERSGSIQIGVEGTMLAGAFTAFAVSLRGAGPWSAFGAAALTGLACGGAFAWLSVARRADPILVGTAWNLLAYGATAFGYRLVAGQTGAIQEIASFAPSWGIPPAAVLAYAAPLLAALLLSTTRFGLRLSAAGERPETLHALGISVVGLRSAASLASGVLAGAAGGLLVLTVSPTFVEGVTAGRGFLALAIVVFSRWRPLALIPAALLLGFGTALQYRLQASGSALPYGFFLALPGLLALVALAFFTGTRGAPRALGSPAP